MKRLFLIAIRNDQSQLLVLEAAVLIPTFPSGVLDGGSELKVITRQVLADTGLTIGGLHLSATTAPALDRVCHLYSAYVTGGKLHSFPTAPTLDPPRHGYSSASWIAPSLISRLAGVSREMKQLTEDMHWIQARYPSGPR